MNIIITRDERKLIDHLVTATAKVHCVAHRKSHLTPEGQHTLLEWQHAKDALLGAQHGKHLWERYCDLYQYNVKTVGLDFFI
jgi:hypothetical protein